MQPSSIDMEALSTISDPTLYPPGTVLLENARLNTGVGDGHLIRIPEPSSDPNDPLNWSKTRKYVNFGLISFYTFMIFVILDVGSVCWGDWVVEWGVTYSDLNNVFAANLTGLAVGCVFFVPLALKYGRRVIYVVSVLITFGMSVWMAEANGYASLLTANLFSGLSGAASEALVQMTVADVFFVHERATLNGVYLLMSAAGAYLGPVASGYIVDAQGWRWLYWWCAIGLGLSSVSMIFLYEDTKFLPAQLGISITPDTPDQDTKDGKVSTFGDVPTSTSQIQPVLPLKTYRQRLALVTITHGSLGGFLRHAYQPFIILFTFPVAAMIIVLYGALLAWLSILLASEPAIFNVPPYNFSANGVGLLFIPGFIGSLIGSIYGGPLSDWSILVLAKRNRGIYEPEMRLYLSLFPVLVGPAGVWLYGYSALEGMHWIVPCVGLAMNSFSVVAISDTTLTYLVDSYPEILGDLLVALAFVRNGLSAVAAFCFGPWVAALGYRNTLLSCGFLALATNLLVIPIIIWGKQLRIQSARRYARMAARQFNPRPT
ncbi:hypothetical protein BP5796_13218 [Coleophoma crateriformis]|uniref:Major facilitator superfamily (MFS) profile domain-containing protein n=1 Tax=Coleophoma crateriformis TaxID=565419 RepID=A0A3D8Q3B5_9HELO|nr:hypothetical protein BP5796_13218 [Coleophoma crateriformis]